MVKLVKGNNRSSFIKGEDVTTTKGAKNPGLPKTVDDALDEVDETLDERHILGPLHGAGNHLWRRLG